MKVVAALDDSIELVILGLECAPIVEQLLPQFEIGRLELVDLFRLAVE
jgi:hypothetical protein